ncbi:MULTISPECIES: bifunctional ornithine acetyltransferase/N-acetylglutamate synthase [Methanobacterium]|jgi:glutamate N-acetyltransferase/amino-acid N-acetyltransferase|uniref:Glutamate N-acetyltransferase n=1 Tax=Methanobacterium veterum TaxID=408577 RepID=A0A9E5A3L4_9EURY|nr:MULTISPECIES: bifunctional ornithine acetyltransferase/N-acetylglutamate synthase [Methanobacterium]MCZ3367455.1 bifunctional ornithine acetyltransferase/N-acetylglutamate synthase [Methanobacterium veterum]MCZ3373397.1 bifunctional ornithine acetyltransferase/N-acetylglutamate synthase [Methanobacterium veterum]
MEIIKGGICAVDGVLASGSRKGKYGVSVIVSKENTASAVFTSNKVVAAPVIVTKDVLKDGKLSAIVANSGNANCFTGEEGISSAKEMTKRVADKLNIDLNDVAAASTGIIGRKLPLDIINALIDESLNTLENSPEASFAAAEAIMTTDTFSKEFAVQTTLKDGSNVKIGGITKGSGMIAPNMGTMLCFITTDVKASAEELNDALKKAVDKSFNMVVVDGDESTNDTVILMSNGSSGKMDENFQEALEYVCIELAKMMAKDGEGETKYMEVHVNGAASSGDAKSASKAIVGSSLVKTALFGADPNWGRVVAAVGYSGAEMDENLVDITFKSDNETVKIVEKGSILAFDGTDELKTAEKIMQNDEIEIIVDLNLGKHSAAAYGCDLSCDYVKINSEYST